MTLQSYMMHNGVEWKEKESLNLTVWAIFKQ